VCVFVYTYTCKYIHIYTQMHIYIYTYIYVYKYLLFSHVFFLFHYNVLPLCVREFRRVGGIERRDMCVCVCVSVFVYLYVCIFTYRYIHSHIFLNFLFQCNFLPSCVGECGRVRAIGRREKCV